MNKAELDKMTERVLSLLRERGVVISGSGSGQRAESAGHGAHAPAERSPFKTDPMLIPVAITDRAACLTKQDIEKCFGTATLHKDSGLSGGDRVVYQETVTVVGPDGDIKDVHVCAPEDNKSQVELLSGDNLILGINCPLRLSGDTECSAACKIVGPSGSVELEEGAIIPMRKILTDPAHASHYGVIQGQIVSVEVSGSRGGVLTNVAVIIREGAAPCCYLDKNEAGAMCVSGATMVKIVK